MTIEELLTRIHNGNRVEFDDVQSVISAHYDYRPTAFFNGLGEDRLTNPSGKNEGSCKIFAFARLHELSKEETLALFGDYYFADVLENPEGTGHANIRAFMKYGWDGIVYEGEALRSR
jgi:hypothetical protein